MPKISIELNRPDVHLPDALRGTVEHLPDRVQSDVRAPDVDLSKLTEVARNVADKVSERAHDLSKIDVSSVEVPKLDLSKVSMPSPEDVGDTARALANRLPRRRRSPLPMVFSVAVIAAAAAILANWATVRPWLEGRIATARTRMNEMMGEAGMGAPSGAPMDQPYPSSATDAGPATGKTGSRKGATESGTVASVGVVTDTIIATPDTEKTAWSD